MKLVTERAISCVLDFKSQTAIMKLRSIRISSRVIIFASGRYLIITYESADMCSTFLPRNLSPARGLLSPTPVFHFCYIG